ncbi:hypothetical protein A4G30_16165 [Mycobacterium kansasii]|nr:hypothetical protein B1T51_16390 [Mycobacterium kansasii]ARG81316.1 hypothetical protein B1T52_16850 [Mycobacterium kansasii]ARG93405.1 hypothetical protein B1T50_17260 [Mycobacterium kansasii]KZS76311.1 hypothetical protein A4G30_16165 [Mycobacterium kansasii]
MVPVSENKVHWPTPTLRGRSFKKKLNKTATDWLFESLLIANHQHYLVGEKESNKSMLMLWIAVQFALDDGGGVVLYLDEENDPGDIENRLADFDLTDEQREKLEERLIYVHFPSLRLNTPTGAQVVLDNIALTSVDLLIIDTVSKFVDGPEDSADTYKKLYEHLLVNLKREKVASVILDHPGHVDQGRPRGTSVKLADVDNGWAMKKGKVQPDGTTDITLTSIKNRSGALPKKVYVRKLLNPLRFEFSLTPFKDSTPTEEPEDVKVRALRLLGEEFPDGVGINKGREFLKGNGVKLRDADTNDLVRAFNDGLSDPESGAGQ